jgi:hypothetical protein
MSNDDASADEAITEDHTDDEHAVDNEDAAEQNETAEAETETPDDVQEARDNSAEARADATEPTKVEPELAEGVDPITGGEKTVTEALVDRVPVMVPESKGDIRTDVTWPQHVQAPPVEQVAGINKSNSSTRERIAAQRENAGG